MKLRNKKTGEIVYIDIQIPLVDGKEIKGTYSLNNLAELNAKWEDYEENKYYYAITSIKADNGITKMKNIHNDMTAFDKSIGNYFETKEEAEQAVEKLKAIKILKDNGFRFIQWEFDMKTIADGKIWFDVGINSELDAEQLLKHRPEVKESLDLLFGGNDESSN